MKTLEVSSLNEGVDSTLQEIDHIQSKITEMQKGVRGIIELEYYLKGKTGEAIRSFYETVHEPFLIFLYESLINYAKVLKALKNDVHSYEADENGLVRQDFMENDVQRGLDKVETVATGIADEANKVMDNISDIVSLPPLDLEEFSHMVQKGRDKVNLYIEQLHELDDKQTKALHEAENDLDLMKSYMSEMTRTFHRDHSISSFNALTAMELTTLPTIMKEVYGDPVTEEKGEDEDNFLLRGLKVAGSTAKGVGTGVYKVGEETVVGVYNTVAHPIQTGSAMWDAASHPIDTSKYIINAIEESYERDMVNGDTESRSHWVTYVSGMIATSIFGTKGAGSVTKAGTTTAKSGAAAAKTGVANASKKVSELDMSSMFPFGPQYQLVPGGNVPFNVVDGKQLKDQLIWQAEKLDGKGTGKKYKNYKAVEYNGTTKINGEVRDTSRRVYQRLDIAYERVDPRTGKSNYQLMKSGRPPIWKDGTKIELHHLIQREPGSMVEIPSSMHKEYDRILHGLVENGGSFRNNPVLKKQYENFRSKYWRW